MSTKLLWRGLLGLIILMSVGGCSSIFDSKTEHSYSMGATDGPILSFYVGGSEFTGSADKQQLSGAFKKGISLQELLRNSGVVEFAKDGKSILSVTDVSLGTKLKWEIQVGDKLLGNEDWDTTVSRTDHIGLMANPKDSMESVESVVLFLNGASGHPELTYSYVLPYTADTSVRSFLKNSGFVQLSENNKTVLMVNEYTPLTDEVWRVKVNGKLLLENGMDMKLHPQDEVEVILNLR